MSFPDPSVFIHCFSLSHNLPVTQKEECRLAFRRSFLEFQQPGNQDNWANPCCHTQSALTVTRQQAKSINPLHSWVEDSQRFSHDVISLIQKNRIYAIYWMHCMHVKFSFRTDHFIGDKMLYHVKEVGCFHFLRQFLTSMRDFSLIWPFEELLNVAWQYYLMVWVCGEISFLTNGIPMLLFWI